MCVHVYVLCVSYECDIFACVWHMGMCEHVCACVCCSCAGVCACVCGVFGVVCVYMCGMYTYVLGCMRVCVHVGVCVVSFIWPLQT